MLRILFISLINLFGISIKGQTIEIGTNIKFDDCNCNQAKEIKYDTIEVNNRFLELKVTCLLDRKRLSYRAYSLNNKIYRNGNFYLFSLLDTLHYVNAHYSDEKLIGFSINNRKGIEVYDVKNNQLDGRYIEYKNNLLFKEGYFSRGVKDSLWVSYYDNREVMSKGKYCKKKIRIDIDKSNNYLNVISNDADTINTKPFSSHNDIINEYDYSDNGLIRFPIIIEYKTGRWEYFDPEGNLIRNENYPPCSP